MALKPVELEHGLTERRDFAGTERSASGEMSASAATAQAQAIVQARYIMALRQPRDVDDFRIRLLKDCERPGFAEVAMYHRSVGGGKMAESASIRMIEAALQHFRNVHADHVITYEDKRCLKVHVEVTDVERNIGYGAEAIIDKTVERRALKDGQRPLGERLNSEGIKVYLVAATESDMRAKVGSEISKLIRGCGERLLPGDVIEEAEQAVRRVRETKVTADPSAERKRLSDAFAGLGIMPSELKKYLGHELDAATPTELIELGGVYLLVKDGESDWRSVLALKTEASPAHDSKATELKQKLAAQVERVRTKKKGRPTPTPAASSDPAPVREPGVEG